MKNIDLINLFSKFSGEEIKEFEKFLKSPFFVKGKSLCKLFKAIINSKIKFTDSNHLKFMDKLCKKLNYTKSTMNKQLSYLSRETLNFFKMVYYRKDTGFSELYLNEFLLNKKYYSYLNSNLKKSNYHFNNISHVNDKTYLLLFQNNIINFTSLIQNTRFISKKNYQSGVNYLDNALRDFLLYSLMQATSIYINHYLLNINLVEENKHYFPFEINEYYKNLSKIKFFDDCYRRKQIYNIYYHMFLTFYYKNDKKNFLNYKKNVEKNLKILNKDLVNFHFNVLINYCNMKDRFAEEKDFYRKESNALLLKYFYNDYFKTDISEFLSPVDFTNFVVRTYSLGELETLKSFIDNNSSKLKPADYNDMVNYGMAYYYLGKRDYRKSLKSINNISQNNPIIKFNIRNIELRIYYELNRKETLLSAIHNYRTTILNDEMLTKADKESLKKLLNYLNTIIRIENIIDPRKRKFEAEYQKKLIEKEPFFALKNWILEKYNNLLSI